MKNYLIALTLLLVPITTFSQNVGINTTSPTRSLDINGDMIITVTNNYTDNPTYKYLVATDKNTGNVDYITFPALDQSDAKNVEISKSIYINNTPKDTETCSCGDITFYVKNADNKAYFKLNSTQIFDVLSRESQTNITSFILGYGIKGWSGTTYDYRNITNKIFNTSNFDTYQEMDSNSFPTGNSADIRIYTIVPPLQNNLYRLTVSRVQNNINNHQYGLMCEKFYIQEI